jgi:hypothetical protein
MKNEEREALGRTVREEWIAWAKEQPDPKPSWLVPWEGLSEPDKEVDRRIGERLHREALARHGLWPEPVPPRDHMDLDLSPRMEMLVHQERSDEAYELRERARQIEKLTIVEYIARGLETKSLHSVELRGRMQSAGLDSLDYDAYRPGWRTRGSHTERVCVRVEEIRAIFAEENKP